MTPLTTPSSNGTEDEFLSVARQAVRSSAADGALASLGWWDLLPQLDDPEARMAVFSVFRAQGGELASSCALGGLLAQPYLLRTDMAGGSVLAAARRDTANGDTVHVVVGDPAGRSLLLDRPGHGAAIVDLERCELVPIEVPGRLDLYEVRGTPAAPDVAFPEQEAAAARARSLLLGRVAIAMEILGAAERAVLVATEYAAAREQFGRPIGTFQAVRHLLAWARTDCIAIEAVTYRALRLGGAVPPLFDEVVKALAGRNGRRACERTLQVLGGIGFTREHDHHHLHSRVLGLDSLLGSSAELIPRLGAELRTSGTHPGFPAHVLLASASL